MLETINEVYFTEFLSTLHHMLYFCHTALIQIKCVFLYLFIIMNEYLPVIESSTIELTQVYPNVLDRRIQMYLCSRYWIHSFTHDIGGNLILGVILRY